MHVDLLTLYFITIGTLLASAGLTFWEHRTHSNRSRSLGILAAGFATLAVAVSASCFAPTCRPGWVRPSAISSS